MPSTGSEWVAAFLLSMKHCRRRLGRTAGAKGRRKSVTAVNERSECEPDRAKQVTNERSECEPDRAKQVTNERSECEPDRVKRVTARSECEPDRVKRVTNARSE